MQNPFRARTLQEMAEKALHHAQVDLLNAQASAEWALASVTCNTTRIQRLRAFLANGDADPITEFTESAPPRVRAVRSEAR